MTACPFCSEEIDAGARRCVHCGEVLGRPPAPPPAKSHLGLAIGLVALGLVAVCVVPSIVLPLVTRPSRKNNEAGAVGALKTIGVCQTLFREGDKDGDEVLDYGTLQELSDAQLVDAALGSGAKQGYVFDVAPAPATPEFLWMAVANPAGPGTTGDRYFVTNHAGVIYYSTSTPFAITPDCAIPSHATPLGR